MSKTLVFMGDSVTDCGRRHSGGEGYPEGDTWGPGYACLIGSKLMGSQPEAGWTIYNRGISGNRIVDLYARWKSDCLNLKPDYISILIGVNDTWHEKLAQNGVEVPRYEMFYRMLLEWSKTAIPSVQFILLEPFVLQFGNVAPDWIPEIRERQEVVRKMAREFGATFVPLQEVFDEACKRAPQEYWLVDGCHPQPAGHQLIADAWFKATKLA